MGEHVGLIIRRAGAMQMIAQVADKFFAAFFRCALKEIVDEEVDGGVDVFTVKRHLSAPHGAVPPGAADFAKGTACP